MDKKEIDTYIEDKWVKKAENGCDCSGETPIVDVYVARIPIAERKGPVYPSMREEEILSCGNPTVRKQKYYVWKLLEYALERTFGYPMQEMKFIKNSHGKWESDFCQFSLSHTDGVVAVAVSNKAVGVDVEPLRNKKISVMEKTLTEREKEAFFSLLPEAKEQFLVEKWTEKESIFKWQNLPRFRPETIHVDDYATESRCGVIAGREYVVSVSMAEAFQVRHYWDVSLE